MKGGKIPGYGNILISNASPHDPLFITVGSTNNATTKAMNTGNSLSRLSFTAAAERVLPIYKREVVTEEKKELKERIAVFIEHNGSRFIRHKLDFDSPRTAEAAAQLGITFEDCLKKKREEFIAPDVDEKIIQLRYDHHCLRVQDAMRSVRDLRNEIVKRDSKRQEGTSQVQSKYQKSKTSIIERSKSATPMPVGSKMGLAEKKRLVDFVQKTWKEMQVIKKLEEPKKQPYEKSKERAETGRGKSRPSLDRINEDRYLTPRRSLERLLSTDRDCKKASYQPVIGCISNSTKNDKRDPYVEQLALQVAVRKQKCAEAMKKLEEKEQIMKAKESKVELKWIETQRSLSAIDLKLRRAEDRLSRVTFQKVIEAVNQERNVNDIKTRAIAKVKNESKKVEGMYIEKTQRIKTSQQKRETRLKAESEDIHTKLILRKQKHAEGFVKVKEKEQKEIETIQERILQKLLRTKPEPDRIIQEHKDYWKEMRRLNIIVQHENVKRMNRIKDHKRKRIWDNHMLITQKNEQLKSKLKARECVLRAQSVGERGSKDAAYRVLEKLMKADPYRKNQRNQLNKALEALSKKLGIELELPQERLLKSKGTGSPMSDGSRSTRTYGAMYEL